MLDEDARPTKLRKVHRICNNINCNDIKGLFDALGLNYEPSHWKLFIDGSLYSIKAILLHIGNTLPSIPVAHSVTLKETYEVLSFILDEHWWGVMGLLRCHYK